ncbi:MAG TPA: hypothetical protein DEH11_06775 [Actinobacteria bacterium]|jgi:hypothetical protein|nr:hypothetical protein [Actinomycetota bacterium]
MTSSATGARQAGAGGSGPDGAPGSARPLVVTGAMAACVAASAGLAVATLLVLAAWIAAPHVGDGLTSVMRAAAVLWLIGHHVGFTSRGGVRIGMLPLGLALLPGALLWRAGRWVVRAGGVSRLRHVGYAALALAAPYGLLTMTLALASQSPQAAPAVLQAGVCGFLLALTAGGLGGARALAPWTRLTDLLPDRARSVIVGAGTALAALVIAGAVLAAVALGTHLTEFATLSRGLAPDAVGGALLLLAQLAYVPNALIWSVSFIVGPGFAIGTGTVVAPTGTVLGQLPAFPMLAALPPGVHSGTAAWLAGLVLAFPYLAGCAGGLLMIRAAPTPSPEMAPLWGLACGGVTGCLLGVAAAFSGGPLGSGRLAAVGPSAWQVAVVAALEVGVAAAVTAGVANWLMLRGGLRGLGGLGGLGRLSWLARPDRTDAAGWVGVRAWPAERGSAGNRGPGGDDSPDGPGRGDRAGSRGRPADSASLRPVRPDGQADRMPGPLPGRGRDDSGHTIYLDPWASDASAVPQPRRGGSAGRRGGPSALP